MDSQPATQADLKALEQRLEGKIDAAEQRLEGKIDTAEQRMLDKVGEMIHASETRILTAFYGYTESTNRRIRTVEMAGTTFFSRIGVVEDRVTDIEKRLNLPPAS